MIRKIKNKCLKGKTAVYLSLMLALTAAFPVYASETGPEIIVGEEEVAVLSGIDSLDAEGMDVQAETDLQAAETAYDEVIHLGECRFLSVSGDKNGSSYKWKVSDDRILSVNPDGRCKGLSSDRINGFSETVVTAEKDGVRHELKIKVLPPMCVDSSTIGVPGAKWDISGMFKAADGKIRYRCTKKKVMSVNKKGIAKGKKAGKTDVIKEVKQGSSWIEVDRETFTIYQPKIKSEMVLSRLKYPTLSANKIIISSDVVPAGFKSSRTGVIGVDKDKLKLYKQGTATIYTLYGTVGKPLKRYKTRIEVIGKD